MTHQPVDPMRFRIIDLEITGVSVGLGYSKASYRQEEVPPGNWIVPTSSLLLPTCRYRPDEPPPLCGTTGTPWIR